MKQLSEKNINRAKKVLLQVAMNLAEARNKKILKSEADEFMFIVATTISVWENTKELRK